MLIRLYTKLIPDFLKENVHSFVYAKNIINCALIALVAVPSYALVFYYQYFPVASITVLITGIFILAAPLVLKETRSLILSRELMIVSLYCCLTWLTYYLGGVFSPTIFWLVLPPM